MTPHEALTFLWTAVGQLRMTREGHTRAAEAYRVLLASVSAQEHLSAKETSDASE